MPRLRRLSGLEIIRILRDYGFEVARVRGSHHVLQRIVTITDEQGVTRTTVQTLVVPVHGKQPVSTGTLLKIYRDAKDYIEEEQLRGLFYAS